jgi:Zn-dependent protease with chaperone function
MCAKNAKKFMILGLVFAVALTAYAADSRTKLKPGFNLFSPQQDVQMGREVSKQAESQLQLVNNRQATDWINSLGRQLAAHAPGEKYPYQFRIVNDTAINAFALPGGFVYVNRGAIDAADNEAQIAGVIAHEIGHVALRHGTNQASKSYIAQAPLAIIGGLAGNSVGGLLTQLGISFAASSVLLKYSRDAESQADLMGTQILYDSGYDPRAMVEFFEKIQNESRGRAVQFLSDHPNPENRISNVQHEIQRFGSIPPNPRTNSAEFQSVKASLTSMPAPRKGGNGRTSSRPSGNNPNGRPASPSRRLMNYNGEGIQFQYPDNWHQYGEGSVLTLAPDGGLINNALAYGMMMSTYDADYHGQGRMSLGDATDQLLNELRRTNPNLRITRSHDSIRIGGGQGYLTEASNESPAGGQERDWIVTTLSPDGTLYYFVGVAPQNEFTDYENAFEDITNTVRFR